MGGKTEPAWMRYPLAVYNKYIRLTLEFFCCGYTYRGLAKRKQPGDIGKGNFSHCICCFYESEIR